MAAYTNMPRHAVISCANHLVFEQGNARGIDISNTKALILPDCSITSRASKHNLDPSMTKYRTRRKTGESLNPSLMLGTIEK